ncbi:MAG: DUF6065 family protein, partial [Armatimonadota bacterium]|nr:DUF6065 family protein [Armatimonadota bacterium]
MQEHCLPFTAATALGFMIGSPIDFGLCPPGEVPSDAHAFRSPLESPQPDGSFKDERVFYVKDNPGCRFVKNAFHLDALEITDAQGKSVFAPVQPGLSFFDRADQLDLFKLHLPYLWRTPPEVDALFLPALNRLAPQFTVLCGLVETDWYANPVNLVIRKPPPQQSIHVVRDQPVAQVIFVARSHRRPTLQVPASSSAAAGDLRLALVKFDRQHAQDRSAYKKLARSRHGR